ncbi:MAG: Phosphomevalonate kinase [Benjaminiella poitrasii]|nr:MAG: Phosphomevalonate kinase [Benjaminiella poitrasii]
MAQNCTVASAPGKVLVAGGYLVLEQAFMGVVVGTSARFYTVIRPETHSAPGIITVRSPQFEKAVWQYKASSENKKLQFESIPTDSQNKFVETCLKFTLNVIVERIGSEKLTQLLENGIDVVIVGDNDFYSQRTQLEKNNLPNTAEALGSLQPFCETHASLSTVHKTGLGSSAALTTSLVAALLLFFKAVTDSLDKNEKTLVHNVAQFAHCFAQGKVGSGFDVSSAVWGSHRYKRFNPAILTSIMNEQVDPKTLSEVLDANNKSWDNEVIPFKLPPGFDLMLADIDAGSHTPTLVSKVLAWKKSKPEEATALWNELGAYNAKVEQHFRQLTTLYEKDEQSYNETIKACAELKSTEWHTLSGPIVQEIVSLVNDFNHVRYLLQTMSKFSEVPIEPEEQTRLLDASTNLPGVVMAGVPGAGGYDAIFCIVLSEKSKQKVYNVWESWKELNIGPLLSRADSHGVTSVKLDDVPGLASVLAK